MPFADYFARFFVIAEAEESGLTEVVVAGPFGEADLADEFWVEPGAVLHLRRGHALAASAGQIFREVGKRAIRPD